VSGGADIRFSTGIKEVDAVLGGGLVQGSLLLISGEPGIGKSTLLLQMAKALCANQSRVLYVSGEESEAQVSLRASRLGMDSEDLYLYSESCLESVLAEAENLKPGVIFVDSIQTVWTSNMDSAPGTVTQVRESTLKIMEFCKQRNIAVVLVGHVTKGGEIAGPRLLEHMVDVVLHFEGDRSHLFRILRGIKNRYGPTDEVGIFEMKSSGLVPVLNPSAYFVSGGVKASGSCTSVLLEGSQPFLVEVQSLVTGNYSAYPKRTSMGLDLNRLNLLIAVIEKRIAVRLDQYDVCVNLAGGLKSRDTGIDLAVVTAIISSWQDKCVPADHLFIGEVGLGGEVRMVPRIEQRVREAAKQGMKNVYVPKSSSRILRNMEADCKLYAISSIAALRTLVADF
jgi:DNA repair protein RadA/Sms